MRDTRQTSPSRPVHARFTSFFVCPQNKRGNKERKPGGENHLSLLVSRFWKKYFFYEKVGEILNLEGDFISKKGQNRKIIFLFDEINQRAT